MSVRPDSRTKRGGQGERVARPYEPPRVMRSLPFEAMVLADVGTNCALPGCTTLQDGTPCP